MAAWCKGVPPSGICIHLLWGCILCQYLANEVWQIHQEFRSIKHVRILHHSTRLINYRSYSLWYIQFDHKKYYHRKSITFTAKSQLPHLGSVWFACTGLDPVVSTNQGSLTLTQFCSNGWLWFPFVCRNKSFAVLYFRLEEIVISTSLLYT